jgi:proteasome accessory factor A
MSKETSVRRQFGAEIEYTYSFANAGKDHNEANINHRDTQGIKQIGQFLENGSRFYIDVGLIEYATPECRTLKELIAHEFTGEEIVRDTYRGEESDLASIHKRSLSPYIISPPKGYGAHENYTTTMNIKGGHISRTRDSLAAHFATRTIFIGAGQPTPEGFRLGQKIHDIQTSEGETSTQNKALVNTRTEHHEGNAQGLHRLHVVCGDANMSPWALRMKFGTTSLMLRLLEHGVDVQDLFLANALDSAKDVAAGVEGINKPLTLRSGKTHSALNIQEELASRAHDLSQRIELPQEENEVIGDWFTIIDALREYSGTGKHQRELSQLDWYTKKQIIDGRRSKEEHKEKDNMRQIKEISLWDSHYDDIEKGWGITLRKKGRFLHNPSDAEKEEARTTPPEGRAKLRGALIKRLSEQGYSTNKGYVGWDFYKNPQTSATKRMSIDGDYYHETVQQTLDEWLPQK